MFKIKLVIPFFLLIIFSLSAQIGPDNKNIVPFLGNFEDYNIQLIGDDGKIYSLPEGFLQDKLDKGFDYLVPSRLSDKYNYLILTYTDWDRIYEIQKKLDKLNLHGPSSENRARRQ